MSTRMYMPETVRANSIKKTKSPSASSSSSHQQL